MTNFNSFSEKLKRIVSERSRDDISFSGSCLITISKNDSFRAFRAGSVIAIISCRKWCLFKHEANANFAHNRTYIDAEPRKSVLRGYAGQVWVVNEPLSCFNNSDDDILLLYWEMDTSNLHYFESKHSPIRSPSKISSNRLDCTFLGSKADKDIFDLIFQNAHLGENDEANLLCWDVTNDSAGTVEDISFGRVLIHSREESDVVVGYMESHFESLGNSIVISFGILREFRRQGYAREVLSAALAFIRSKAKECELNQQQPLSGQICARVAHRSKSSDTAKSLLLSKGFEWHRNRTIGALRNINDRSNHERDDVNIVSEYRTWIM